MTVIFGTFGIEPSSIVSSWHAGQAIQLHDSLLWCSGHAQCGTLLGVWSTCWQDILLLHISMTVPCIGGVVLAILPPA